jgi:carotenoid cleavage dioxygenase-like enzyme
MNRSRDKIKNIINSFFEFETIDENYFIRIKKALELIEWMLKEHPDVFEAFNGNITHLKMHFFNCNKEKHYKEFVEKQNYNVEEVFINDKRNEASNKGWIVDFTRFEMELPNLASFYYDNQT